MLLELLSHQNLADQSYGLDPRFRFHVSRAVYKGILKYLSYNSGSEYCRSSPSCYTYGAHSPGREEGQAELGARQ